MLRGTRKPPDSSDEVNVAVIRRLHVQMRILAVVTDVFLKDLTNLLLQIGINHLNDKFYNNDPEELRKYVVDGIKMLKKEK
jgi:hypothetical protein